MARSFVAIVVVIGTVGGIGADTFASDAMAAAGVVESANVEVIAGSDLLGPDLLPLLVEVFMRGGAGYLRTEASSFLVVDAEGTYRTIAWPKSNEWQAARFSGVIPKGAVAIIHTHPMGSPRPSRADAATARKTALPVLVLTARDIFVANPDGSNRAVVRGRFWAESRTQIGYGAQPFADRAD